MKKSVCVFVCPCTHSEKLPGRGQSVFSLLCHQPLSIMIKGFQAPLHGHLDRILLKNGPLLKPAY